MSSDILLSTEGYLTVLIPFIYFLVGSSYDSIGMNLSMIICLTICVCVSLCECILHEFVSNSLLTYLILSEG